MISETEQKILDAARIEFVEKGKAGARMQAIAERAEVNKALLHYYFRSKDKLYQAVFSQILEKVWCAIQESLHNNQGHGQDLRAMIRTFVATYINTLKSHPEFPRLLLRELADGGTFLPQVFETITAKTGNLPQMFFGMLQTATMMGRVNKLPPLHILLNVVGMSVASFILQPIAGIMFQKAGGQPLEFDEKFYQERIDAIVEMACNGIFTQEYKA
jgi:AcrR family transcriptional regulator